MKDIKYCIAGLFLLVMGIALLGCGEVSPSNAGNIQSHNNVNSRGNGGSKRFTCTAHFVHNGPDIYVYTDSETNKEYIVEAQGCLLYIRDIPAEKNGEKTSKQ